MRTRRLLVPLLLLLFAASVAATGLPQAAFPRPSIDFSYDGTNVNVLYRYGTAFETVQETAFHFTGVDKNDKWEDHSINYFNTGQLLHVTYQPGYNAVYLDAMHDAKVCTETAGGGPCTVTYRIYYGKLSRKFIRLVPVDARLPTHKYRVLNSHGLKVPKTDAAIQPKPLTANEQAINEYRSLFRSLAFFTDDKGCVHDLQVTTDGRSRLGIAADAPISVTAHTYYEPGFRTPKGASQVECTTKGFTLAYVTDGSGEPVNHILKFYSYEERPYVCKTYQDREITIESHCIGLTDYAYPLNLYESLKQAYGEKTLKPDSRLTELTWDGNPIRWPLAPGGQITGLAITKTTTASDGKTTEESSLSRLCDAEPVAPDAYSAEKGEELIFEFDGKEVKSGLYLIPGARTTGTQRWIHTVWIEPEEKWKAKYADTTSRSFAATLDCPGPTAPTKEQAEKPAPEPSAAAEGSAGFSFTPKRGGSGATGGSSARSDLTVTITAPSGDQCYYGTPCNLNVKLASTKNDLPETCIIGFTNGQLLTKRTAEANLYRGDLVVGGHMGQLIGTSPAAPAAEPAAAPAPAAAGTECTASTTEEKSVKLDGLLAGQLILTTKVDAQVVSTGSGVRLTMTADQAAPAPLSATIHLYDNGECSGNERDRKQVTIEKDQNSAEVTLDLPPGCYCAKLSQEDIKVNAIVKPDIVMTPNPVTLPFKVEASGTAANTVGAATTSPPSADPYYSSSNSHLRFLTRCERLARDNGLELSVIFTEAGKPTGGLAKEDKTRMYVFPNQMKWSTVTAAVKEAYPSGPPNDVVQGSTILIDHPQNKDYVQGGSRKIITLQSGTPAAEGEAGATTTTPAEFCKAEPPWELVYCYDPTKMEGLPDGIARDGPVLDLTGRIFPGLTGVELDEVVARFENPTSSAALAVFRTPELQNIGGEAITVGDYAQVRVTFSGFNARILSGLRQGSVAPAAAMLSPLGSDVQTVNLRYKKDKSADTQSSNLVNYCFTAVNARFGQSSYKQSDTDHKYLGTWKWSDDEVSKKSQTMQESAITDSSGKPFRYCSSGDPKQENPPNIYVNDGHEDLFKDFALSYDGTNAPAEFSYSFRTEGSGSWARGSGYVGAGAIAVGAAALTIWNPLSWPAWAIVTGGVVGAGATGALSYFLIDDWQVLRNIDVKVEEATKNHYSFNLINEDVYFGTNVLIPYMQFDTPCENVGNEIDCPVYKPVPLMITSKETDVKESGKTDSEGHYTHYARVELTNKDTWAVRYRISSTGSKGTERKSYTVDQTGQEARFSFNGERNIADADLILIFDNVMSDLQAMTSNILGQSVIDSKENLYQIAIDVVDAAGEGEEPWVHMYSPNAAWFGNDYIVDENVNPRDTNDYFTDITGRVISDRDEGFSPPSGAKPVAFYGTSGLGWSKSSASLVNIPVAEREDGLFQARFPAKVFDDGDVVAVWSPSELNPDEYLLDRGLSLGLTEEITAAIERVFGPDGRARLRVVDGKYYPYDGSEYVRFLNPANGYGAAVAQQQQAVAERVQTLTSGCYAPKIVQQLWPQRWRDLCSDSRGICQSYCDYAFEYWAEPSWTEDQIRRASGVCYAQCVQEFPVTTASTAPQAGDDEPSDPVLGMLAGGRFAIDASPAYCQLKADYRVKFIPHPSQQAPPYQVWVYDPSPFSSITDQYASDVAAALQDRCFGMDTIIEMRNGRTVMEKFLEERDCPAS